VPHPLAPVPQRPQDRRVRVAPPAHRALHCRLRKLRAREHPPQTPRTHVQRAAPAAARRERHRVRRLETAEAGGVGVGVGGLRRMGPLGARARRNGIDAINPRRHAAAPRARPKGAMFFLAGLYDGDPCIF